MLITTNGTLAHNILFAENDVELIILNRFFEPNGNIHQNMIGKRYKQNIVNSTSKYATHATSIILQNDMLRECFESIGIVMPNRLVSLFYNLIEYIQFVFIVFIKRLYKGMRRRHMKH